ncbi:hypothetical protein H3H37_18095 [Duganella sp. LX20W]|uniref:Tetratricopeptide repeat protein n=1 Tax=Rugamonas brunnea TaxID=2758569 RepID=A0A7W2EUU6_9BURK|nr:hypothetical protein [Rugamonas brunnea]MBA5638975.1 hypothetical protein [Rugamonas brunnea]
MVKRTGSIAGEQVQARKLARARQAGMTRPMVAAAAAVLVLMAGAGLYYVKSGPATQSAADEAANHPAPPPEAGPIQKDSKTVNQLMNLAISHIEQGNLDEAEKDLQAARAHAPQQPLVAYNTAILRVKQHRMDDALRELEASFAAGFSYFDQLDMDNDLDPLRDDPRFVALVAKYRKPAPAK